MLQLATAYKSPNVEWQSTLGYARGSSKPVHRCSVIATGFRSVCERFFWIGPSHFNFML